MLDLDFRDIEFWINESLRKTWQRRIELMEASLLPNQNPGYIKRKINKANAAILEIEHKDEAEEMEEFEIERRKFYAEALKSLKGSRKKRKKRIKK